MVSWKDQSLPGEGREAPGPMLSFDVPSPEAGVGPISQAPGPLDNLTPAGAGGRVWRLGVGVLTSRRHLPHTLEESEGWRGWRPPPLPHDAVGGCKPVRAQARASGVAAERTRMGPSNSRDLAEVAAERAWVGPSNSRDLAGR